MAEERFPFSGDVFRVFRVFGFVSFFQKAQEE